jgi:hypothetical protein
VVALAVAARLVLVLACAHVAADVRRYERVGEWILSGHLDPYALQRLYPYPPVWVWIEAASLWLARSLGLSFAVLVKLPVVAADAGLVLLLWRWGHERGLGARGAWLYALHPVSLLVSAVHGQFDALMLLPMTLAVAAHERGRHDRAALALAGAVAVKSFPVLLVPPLVLRASSPRAALRAGLLATLPVVLLLAPYVVADPPGVARELLGYGGVADFGWIAVVRGLIGWRTGALPRSEAAHWPTLVPAAKAAFLLVYAGLLLWAWRRRREVGLHAVVLAVLLAFLTFYGAISAQYLLWVVPLAVLAPGGAFIAYSIAATAALAGFYVFFYPELLVADPSRLAGLRAAAGTAWLAGAAAVVVVSGLWLASLVREE